jgi:alpha-L-fucosidase 2
MAGSVEGIRARGGLIVDMHWAGGRVRSLLVQGPPGASFGLQEGESLAQVSLNGRDRYSLAK